MQLRIDRTLDLSPVRSECPRCRRPQAHCYCDKLAPMQSQTRVVFLQHPREARMPVGTARMAHLALPNSELHVGVLFDDHPRVRQLSSENVHRTALLFPGEGARDASTLEPGEIETLVVIDGTWPQARKLIRENALLRGLPRIGFTPSKPGNYRIRKEPAEHCVATIEAVVEALGLLEGAPGRFTPMLRAFDYMVDRQIDAHANRQGPPRRRIRTHDEPTWRRALQAVQPHLVLVHAEVNAHPRSAPIPGRPELVHLVAERVRTGERFEALVRPRRPLAQSTPFHAGVAAEAMLAAPDVAEALARWTAWIQPEDVLAGWGAFAHATLVEEGFPTGESCDLRHFAVGALDRKPGAPDDALRTLGAEALVPWAPGRAGRTLATLRPLVDALLAIDARQ